MDYAAYNGTEPTVEEKKDFDVINAKGLVCSVNDIAIEDGTGKREGHELVKVELVVDDGDFINRRLWLDYDLDHEIGAKIFRQAVFNIDAELGSKEIASQDDLVDVLKAIKLLKLVVNAYPSKPSADGKIWQRTVIKGSIEEEAIEVEELDI